MDGGAWQATVHEVAKGRTRLSVWAHNLSIYRVPVPLPVLFPILFAFQGSHHYVSALTDAGSQRLGSFLEGTSSYMGGSGCKLQARLCLCPLPAASRVIGPELPVGLTVSALKWQRVHWGDSAHTAVLSQLSTESRTCSVLCVRLLWSERLLLRPSESRWAERREARLGHGGQEARAEWRQQSWEWRLSPTVEGPDIRMKSLPLSCLFFFFNSVLFCFFRGGQWRVSELGSELKGVI